MLSLSAKHNVRSCGGGCPLVQQWNTMSSSWSSTFLLTGIEARPVQAGRAFRPLEARLPLTTSGFVVVTVSHVAFLM